ncbi:amino acid ABC transporter substrate-binding protein [Xanthobacter sp. YC-JY1]|uniref:amino acid ABC transporter substrate-binding protein n=1 Tax=Xanthobacter sp. YC-JY1 TaxID=2419844 RepID=UPI001F326954|nr:amino acid ABC transporter substrate-binding protein [Xanthobacter sp. YC-JY1]UJX47297.1 branched-chain amino acid ABC transporter substrate-binding protein [Xanthobacter sp. YC-JY1]
MKRRQFLKMSRGIGFLAAGAAVGPFVAPTHAQTSGRKSIRIGMSVASTGTFAHDSQSGRRAIDLWLEQVNAQGGLLHQGQRYQVELLVRDDRSDKQLAPRVYESLIFDEKVDLVLAPYGSTLTAAAATITDRNDIFMMGWAVAADSVFMQGYKYIVNGGTTPVSRVPEMPVQALKRFGGKVVSTIAVDEPYSDALAGSFRATAEKHGLAIGATEKYSRGAKDFTTILNKAAAAKTGLLCITSYDTDMIVMLRQMKENDINFPAIFSTFSQNSSILALGNDAIGLWGQSNIDPRVAYAVNLGPTAAQYLDAYNAKYPNGPQSDINSAVAFASLMVLGAMIERAPSLKARDLKAAALDLSGHLTVLNGTYRIDETGFQTGYDILVIQNTAKGGREVIAPAAVATAAPLFPMPTWDQKAKM